MSHTPEQKALSIAIAKRDAAKASLERFRQSVAALAAAEQTATKAEAEARAQLEAAIVAKVKGNGEPDTTASARNVYQLAMADLAVAETEHAAGERVVTEAERDLEQLSKAAHRAAVEVAKAVAAHEQPRLVAAARAYGQALHRHKALIRFARAASADSGLIADPIADIQNANNPLKLQIDALTSGTELDPLRLTESEMLEAKIGGSNVG
jgi:hypothetical protein